jgi:hypothetical protein
MKCRHCGNKVLGEAKYCTLCGNLVSGGKKIVKRTEVENPIDENKRQSSKKLYYDNSTNKYSGSVGSNNKNGIGCLVFLVLIAIFPFFIVGMSIFSIFDSFQADDYITVGNEDIPSLYSVVGEVEICSYSSEQSTGESFVSIEYCDSGLDVLDVDSYVDYLIENENFQIANDYNSTILVRDAFDYGYQIVVKIDYDSYQFEYQKVLSSEFNYNYEK